MQDQEDRNERLNVYADDVYGKSIHISDAESGQNGYYCQGCKNELQAIKSKLPNRVHFFRHVAIDVKIERKCVYSDQTYRHKLAKELLARLKHIKTPAVYKYPPKEFEGLANLLKEAILVDAHSVEMERVFYETEAGEIKWGSGHGVDEKYLLVRPDVIFFDVDKNPILFVELVATHKVDIEKKAKLRRLGIDTLEVKIPRDSPAAIEAALYSSDKIKWIYNNDEERAKYIPVPLANSAGISPIDEQQRRLLAETFECRQAEVRNLVRTITRVLESKQYGDVAAAIESELSRVERNTKEHQSELDQLRENHRNTVAERYAERRKAIEEQRTKLEQEQADFEREHADLENRYITKRTNLEGEAQSIDQEQRIVNRQLSGEGEDGTGIGRSNIRIKDDLEQLILEEESEIGRIEQELEETPGSAQSDQDALIKKLGTSTEREKAEAIRIESEMAELPEKFESNRKRLGEEFEEKEGKLPGEFKPKENELEREFEELRERSHKTIMSRNGTGNADAAVRVRQLLEARGVLDDLEQVQRYNKRNRTAWKCYNEGTYQNWLD